MSVSYQKSAVAYAGNVSTVTPYVIPFTFFDEDDVKLGVLFDGDTEATAIDASDFTVTKLDDNSGGTLVTDVAYAAADSVIIYRRTARVQELDLPPAGPFPAESVEEGLDKLELQIQELTNDIRNLQGDPEAILIPPGDTEQDFIDTRTFANPTEKNLATPERVGQLAVITSTRELWYGSSVTVGGWTLCLEQAEIAEIAYTSGINARFNTWKTLFCNVTGDLTIAWTNKTAGARLRLLLISDASSHALTWPAGTQWAGGAVPATLAASGWLIVDVLSKSTTDAAVYVFAFSESDGGVSDSIGYQTTSASSFAIGNGSKSFVVPDGLSWSAGQRCVIASEAAPTVDYMNGVVTGYGGGVLIVTVDSAVGTGTHTDWLINLAGERGSDGAAGANGTTFYGQVIAVFAGQHIP